jgi:UDP-N-acetylglucosamine 2-epimerase (non-hydrolysing)
MRIVYVVGTRPNIVKMAPVLRALRRRMPAADHVLIHTGQHYDRLMSEVFLEQLRMTSVGHMLGVGSDTHSEQTARVMAGLETCFQRAAAIERDYGATPAAAPVVEASA